MTEKIQESEVSTGVETRARKPKAEKREVISISVTPEEKRRISVEALKDYGTTVSDLIRSRMFVKKGETEADEDLKSESEELEVYEEVIQQLKTEITELKERNLSLQLQMNESEESNDLETEQDESLSVQKENILLLEFETNDFGGIIQKIKSFRSELFVKTKPEELENFHDLESFAKLMFFRGLKRSYNNGILNESTGLRIGEVKHFAEMEGFNYDEGEV